MPAGIKVVRLRNLVSKLLQGSRSCHAVSCGCGRSCQGSMVRVAATAATSEPIAQELGALSLITIAVSCAGADSYPCPCLSNLRRGCRL